MRAAVILDLNQYPRPLRALEAWLEALVISNVQFLEANPTFPRLYQAGVVYKPEGSPEIWRDIPTCARDGWGDCDDLACWLATHSENAAWIVESVRVHVHDNSMHEAVSASRPEGDNRARLASMAELGRKPTR